MNRVHLADALDYWKGGMIQILKAELNDLAILPMITDNEKWAAGEIAAYSEILGRDPDEILLADVSFNRRRGQPYYFRRNQVRDHHGDLFVDPDTGIEPDGGPDRKHITIAEIEILFPLDDSQRLVMIYQHATRENVATQRGQLTKVIRRIVDHNGLSGIRCCVYVGQQVLMFFLSRSQCRINSIRRRFEDLLSNDSSLHDRRIWVPV
jgi:hypothetical protein